MSDKQTKIVEIMKTLLPESIQSVDDAKSLLKALIDNNESFHPEDDAHDIVWDSNEPTDEEKDQLNKLMSDIYNLPECEFDKKTLSMEFDPCGFILDNTPE